MNKLTTAQFIERAKAVHGDDFDYSRTDYSRLDIKTEIICKNHGTFMQTPAHHLRGHKCPKCRNRSGHGIKKKFDFNDTVNFVKRAKLLHKDAYDYSQVKYGGTNTKVTIICRVHAEFSQTPHNHLRGAGCERCHSDSKRQSMQQFIQKSQNIHGSKYDYSEFSYKNSKTPGTIICPIHGAYKQTPNAHLYYGCYKCSANGGYCESWFCSESRRTMHARIYLLYFNSSDEAFYKVGITTKKKRFGKKYRGYSVTEIVSSDGNLYDMFKLEQRILNELVIDYKYTPSKFPTGNGRTECFKVDETTLHQIKGIIKNELHRQNNRRCEITTNSGS